ncbi:MAG TPA: tetratricopeptide repeat protein, partial [Polyangia bacterium]|nr:tetratricopeptide repeat protein [Polyangia bacterium]
VAPRPARVSAPRANPTRAPARAHPTDDPGELLAAADGARRARRPAAAVASLRRLVDHHPGDPRAPSAAFTLGWVLLTDLDRPREAAQAFAEAERIAPRGTLAEDAAARVVEAWQKAGESGRATEAARRYLRLYASGRYTGLMRGLVGEH